MLYFTNEKKDCTGCSACYNSCPVKCITMQQDKEGFLYPVASKDCIHCGKCKSVCPIQNADNNQNLASLPPKAYCALTKDKKVWKRSSSGGAFTEICKVFGDKNTIVCGAVWDGFTVHHICIEGVENIAPLCKSKYIASSLENVFEEINSFLQQNKEVVFCGTPCQVHGLKIFLGDKLSSKDNILFIDLICHGTGSPGVFEECIKQLGKQLGMDISQYEFRAKRNVWETDYLAKASDEHNGKSKYVINDQYIQLFLNQNCLRPSCGQNCQYRCEQRQGDITIADFKGLKNVFPSLSGTKRNYSSVIVNTAKGEQVMTRIKDRMKVIECSVDDIKKYNPLFYRQTWFSKDRDNFFEDFKLNRCHAIKKWTSCATIYKRSIKKRVYDFLPVFVRKFVVKRK